MIYTLSRLFTLDFLSGWKTRVAGWAMVLHGGSQVVTDLLNGQSPSEVALMEVFNGFALIGLRNAAK